MGRNIVDLPPTEAEIIQETRIARQLLYSHGHNPGDRSLLTRESCATCVLRGHGAGKDGPNYSGWHLVYVQTETPVKLEWRQAFNDFISKPSENNELYRLNVLRWIKAMNYHGHEE